MCLIKKLGWRWTLLNITELEAKTITELHTMAKENSISGCTRMKKRELIFEILKAETEKGGLLFAEGVLEIIDNEGYGFLRPFKYVPSSDDIYISSSQISRFALRTGDVVSGQVRRPKENEKYLAILRIEAVNYQDPEQSRDRPHFEDLTPLFPTERFPLSRNGAISTRLIDLVTPIGKGQRGLIVSPPKAGKTVLLKKVANSILSCAPEVKMMILLVDERPEEVTDMDRSVDTEVISSTFDEPPENHIKVIELVLKKAKRLVEQKNHVVILLDSITRLARAYNVVMPSSGRTLSGGLDPVALNPPKHFFGAARNIEEGGSLTILATALIDTGSRMDDVIYEEFKGTGNMEIHLNRQLAEQRLFPAIDLHRSGTRKEELLLSAKELETMWNMRKGVVNIDRAEIISSFIQQIKNTRNNSELLEALRHIF